VPVVAGGAAIAVETGVAEGGDEGTASVSELSRFVRVAYVVSKPSEYQATPPITAATATPHRQSSRIAAQSYFIAPTQAMPGQTDPPVSLVAPLRLLRLDCETFDPTLVDRLLPLARDNWSLLSDAASPRPVI
jgi:hypothetical protein